MPSNRLSRGFVALAASAIAAVYAGGYVHTQAADATLGTSTGTLPVESAPADEPRPVPVPSSPAVAAALVSSPGATRSTPRIITDQAVEEFANVNHVSWDDARAQMEAAGGVSEHTPNAMPSAPPYTATPRVLPPLVAAPATRAQGVAGSAGRTQAPVTPATAMLQHPTATPSAIVHATPTAVVHVALPSPSRTAAPAVVAGFKDGTYSGVGSSRRGDIQVSLVVQSGRIASVNITRATTQYSTRLIASLPGEVVSRQNAQVDLVSGATYSSMAFRAAVQQALQGARA